MRKFNIKEMHRGWFIGDFLPSVLRTTLFEVGILKHQKGEEWPKHYHAEATEYNVLINGSMTVNNNLIKEGEIFVLEKNEICNPIFHKDCTVLCVKVPSIPGDKYEVF
tara:strand:+ start:1926 stop:2249 length:324 start_codon:yes stop_codon:yes gene_type:complete